MIWIIFRKNDGGDGGGGGGGGPGIMMPVSDGLPGAMKPAGPVGPQPGFGIATTGANLAAIN